MFLSCQAADADQLARPVRDALRAQGYHAVIVMDEPLLRGMFDPESKVTGYIDAADAFLALCTDDARNPGKTAQNIIDEIGRARMHPKLRDVVGVLKEPSVTLPSNINPTWERLSVTDPAAALVVIESQLEAWDVRPDTASPAPTPSLALPPDVLDDLVEGVGLGDHDVAERRLLALLTRIRKRFHEQIVSGLFEQIMAAEEDSTRIHVISSFLETAARIDPELIRPEWIAALAESPIVQHRMAAASILWDLAEVIPGAVPLDLVASLAKPANEDWYVFSPAVGAAKQLVLTRKSATGIFELLARSDDPEDRRSAAVALLESAAINAALISEKLARRLARDTDETVAEQGRRLLEKIGGVTERDRRWVYGKFGLGGAASEE